ncbi:MAG: right-handed parallel beta-helix repeat-containing protein [Pseudomonadales bacterium]
MFAADSIDVATFGVDPATLCCIGLTVALEGDDDHDAVARVWYRQVGYPSWREGSPLLRLRPETVSRESPPGSYGLPVPQEGFAGSIFDLEPGVDYELHVEVTDPDGGNATFDAFTATRPVPKSEPAAPTQVPVASSAELVAALATAAPGNVLDLAPGTYSGPIAISSSGTADNPIIIRGAAADLVTIDGLGATYAITVSGSHVYVEGLSIVGAIWGMQLSGAEGIVVRNVKIQGVNRGIDARGGTKRGFYVCDNELRGPFEWPNISSATWNEEGIVITGQGHTVCHNTVAGFGDALGMSQNTVIPNVAIDFYGNEVLWSADDGIELDYGHRNIRAFRNRVMNTSMGISVQPSWGGPVYIFRNVLINQASSPYKFNNDPSGILVFNNTSIRSAGGGNYGGAAWPQIGYLQSWGDWSYVANIDFLNNIVFGTTQPAKITSRILLGRIDFNGWFPDGTFQLFDSYPNLAAVQSGSPFEASGLILDPYPFAAPVALGADYTTFVSSVDVSLLADSLAIDKGKPILNITDGYVGLAPDLGAYEFGIPVPAYGPRLSPPVDPDTDNDGIPNSVDTDDDGDGLSDVDEITVFGTNPLRADTDGDGLSDGREVELELDPLDPNDCPAELCPPAGGVLKLLPAILKRREEGNR